MLLKSLILKKEDFLTKKTFARLIAKKYKLKFPQAVKIVEVFLGGLEECLRQKKGIRLLGKFTMSIHTVPARTRKVPKLMSKGEDKEAFTPEHLKVMMYARSDFQKIVNEEQ